MLSKWAQKLRIPGPTASHRSESSAAQSSSAPEDTLPVLPHPRPRPITPPPAPNDSPHTYRLFDRVPIEFRRQILAKAFGGQTIHIDLVHERLRDNPQGSSNKKHRLRRAPRAPQKSASGPALHKLKPKSKKGWRWYSCVCHADLPSGTQPWSRFAEPIPRLEVQCFFPPHGWMLAAIDGESPGHLPPYSLHESFYELMRHLPPVLSNLQTLHLSLISTTARPFPSSDAASALAELMKPVEDMLRQLPPTIIECTVAVPSSLYRASRDEAIAEGRRPVDHFCRRQRERHWRELNASTGIDGYWMQLGKTDLSPFAVVSTG
ncbi:hypothetical protein CSOJ01_03825 [Colletotrichum sojae]|uniref:Uncharacterized protein n=1 Tax=Colletotrichum sojae TaxID=2175907 RepID=A0A8H6JKD4_9PEZI|nr:hypothetical protein CSOJ01_03825 [Colletotrichum sojae]